MTQWTWIIENPCRLTAKQIIKLTNKEKLLCLTSFLALTQGEPTQMESF